MNLNHKRGKKRWFLKQNEKHIDKTIGVFAIWTSGTKMRRFPYHNVFLHNNA